MNVRLHVRRNSKNVHVIPELYEFLFYFIFLFAELGFFPGLLTNFRLLI